MSRYNHRLVELNHSVITTTKLPAGALVELTIVWYALFRPPPGGYGMGGDD
jgi:hypothetical protein